MIDLTLSGLLSQGNDASPVYYNSTLDAANNTSFYSDDAQFNFSMFTSSAPFEITTSPVVPRKRLKCQEMYNPYEKFYEFDFWVCGVVLNVVGVLGILGNILSMIILSRPQMRSSINYLLIGLARCDTVLIITSMLIFGIPAIYPYTGHLFYYYYVIFPNISLGVFPLAMASQTASVYMTLIVTLERYVAVCHPLRARAWCTYGRAKIFFIVCIVFAMVYNIPRFWEVETLAESPNGNDVIFCVKATKLRVHPTYISIYIHWCYLVFIYFIPFLSLIVFNCLIYRQIKRANRERQRLSRSERREIGLAVMLLGVVIVFFLLNFLALYTNILEAFYGIIDDYLVTVSNLLVTINSSANFVIYVIFGEKFKRVFLLLFCKRRIERDTPEFAHYDSSNSNGDGLHRTSSRFSRHSTVRSTIRNGTTNTLGTKKKRAGVASPSPCVYYSGRELTKSNLISEQFNKFGNLNNELNPKNGSVASGF